MAFGVELDLTAFDSPLALMASEHNSAPPLPLALAASAHIADNHDALEADSSLVLAPALQVKSDKSVLAGMDNKAADMQVLYMSAEAEAADHNPQRPLPVLAFELVMVKAAIDAVTYTVKIPHS